MHWINQNKKKIDDCENIHSVNPSYLIISQLIGHIQEKNGNKYLVFDSTAKNKEELKKYVELWDGIKNEWQMTINAGEAGEYGKHFIKIKFDTDDDLPLNKLLKLHMLTIVIRTVFEEDGKLYPQISLDECLHEL